METDPGDEPSQLASLTDLDLALERMDSFDRLELAEYAWEQFARSPEQDPGRADYLSTALNTALSAWLASRAEQMRRRA